MGSAQFPQLHLVEADFFRDGKSRAIRFDATRVLRGLNKIDHYWKRTVRLFGAFEQVRRRTPLPQNGHPHAHSATHSAFDRRIG